MGVIFLLARVCGAVSDPVTGFLSDRTRTGLGRRRPWLLASVLPVAVVFTLMWSPPASLSGAGLALWMGAAVIAFQTGINVFFMPHDALGAELSDDYHDRNRIFGVRRIVSGIGSLATFAVVAQLAASAEPRRDAFLSASFAALATVLIVGWMVARIRERPEYQGRGAAHPFRALRDVFANDHARLLLGVFFAQQLAIGAVTIMAAYHTEYVLRQPTALPLILGSFFVVSILSVPVWLRLGQRFEKKQLLVASMAMVSAAIGGIFFVGPGDVIPMAILAGIGGAAGGGADVVFPSLQADVIDWDEHRTGERKEGTYFAAWNFVSKTALGLVAGVTGFALAAGGFEPNQEQSESSLFAIRFLMSGWPLVCWGAGALLFLRFGLTRAAHAELRAELDARVRPAT
jgi:GPH family glycoside/pentoside/hexuronide:cation symporter